MGRMGYICRLTGRRNQYRGLVEVRGDVIILITKLIGLGNTQKISKAHL
jgi:hypothetical protein